MIRVRVRIWDRFRVRVRVIVAVRVRVSHRGIYLYGVSKELGSGLKFRV